MAYDAKTRAKLRAAYVQGLPLNTAAASVKVPYNTARNWKRDDAEQGLCWDTERDARRMSRGGMEEVTKQIFGELAEQFSATLTLLRNDKTLSLKDRSQALMQLGDSYVKAVAAASRAAPNLNRLATAMDVTRFFTQDMAEHAPKLREQFLTYVEAAGPRLAREFDGKS